MTDTLARLTTALADRYRVQRELGAGGMATVYLAHDLRHERDVAIKVLHPDLGATLGGERFLTEIRTTARLQHPHILPLLDSGEADGLLFYVMPFIAGETLRAKLTREKVLPVADAVRITREIAGALDYAHRQQVIHRDIKPENILLHDGSALVADFGIALAVQQAGGARMTQTGLSLGTPQYMSPEQAMGERSIDARSDLYALGAMCYEMLTGDAPFTGNTVQAIVAKVMTEKPVPLRTVRDTVPLHVEQAVLACLAKLPADRPATAKEFAEALSSTAATSAATSDAPTRASKAPAPGRMTLIAGAVALLAVGIITGSQIGRGGGSGYGREDEVTYASLMPAADETWELNDGLSMAVSPDGRRVAVIGQLGGRSGLMIRSLDTLDSRLLPGTEGAQGPFWAPDGKSIGFFAADQLKVVDLSTGTTRALCKAAGSWGTWGANDVIVYQAGGTLGLHRTTAEGGSCEQVGNTFPAGARMARPQFFADGEHLLLSVSLRAWLTNTAFDSLSALTETNRSRAVTAGAKHIAFFANGSDGVMLQEVDFKERRLTGKPTRLAWESVNNNGGNLALSFSSTGTLVTDQGRTEGARQYLRASSNGIVTDSVAIPSGVFGTFRFSHDGQRIMASGWKIAIADRAQLTWTDLIPPVMPATTFSNAAWSPGDSLVAFGVGRTATESGALRIANVRDGSTRTVYRDSSGSLLNVILTDWSPDGRYLVFNNQAGRHGPSQEVWTLDLENGALRDVAWGDGNATAGTISPDGKWLAWAQTGADNRTAIYVRPFQSPGVPVRVSPGEGQRPRWHPTTGELLYTSETFNLVAARLSSAGTPLGNPRTVVTLTALGGREPTAYEVDPVDGSILIDVGSVRRRPLTLLLNWPALLRTSSTAR